uniref:Uncharacterized protein n=1 Tax=Arundo donax TaxID=35708 RepID=A0A0A8YYL7_ARUDO
MVLTNAKKHIKFIIWFGIDLQ